MLGGLSARLTRRPSPFLARSEVPVGRLVADHAGFDTYDSYVRAKRIFNVQLILGPRPHFLGPPGTGVTGALRS